MRTPCRGGRLRSGLRWGVGLLLLALAVETWLVRGLFVPVVVSGGSMATTLLGPHRRVECAQCHHVFPVGVDRRPPHDQATCPQCGHRCSDVTELPVQPGQRLWIDRMTLAARRPKRWELVAFRSPDEADHLSVKRVVGLPGETIRIRGGDLYVNGQIVRKDLDQQRAVAQRVDRSERPADGGANRWRAEDARSGWTCLEETASYGATRRGAAEGPIDWLVFGGAVGSGIRDGNSYNAGVSRRLSHVSDLMLTCRVRVDGEGDLLWAIGDVRDPLVVRIALEGRAMHLEHSGNILMRRPISARRLRRETQVELSLFDAQLLLALDREEVLRYPFEPAGRTAEDPGCRLAIGCRGLRAVVSHLAVWRDVYYTRPPRGGWAVDRPFRIGSDAFFVLGDNSPISFDSRGWRRAGLPGRLLVGTLWTPPWWRHRLPFPPAP